MAMTIHCDIASAEQEIFSGLAELVVERLPGVEQIRFANSGTEGVMFAVMAARAATGREAKSSASAGASAVASAAGAAALIAV
mgnify:CR=1 FL=1